ncbi:MAG: CZB domain-containing protein [Burkholderiales bacterium]|nr:CZB domain-containing protein [Burkholderiales bacterium]
MFEALKRFLGGAPEHTELDSGSQKALELLDIEAAKAAHLNWKIRLHAYLEGKSNENFAPEVICFDDRCDLGKWIHGEGKQRLGRFPGFTALVSHHKMFHYDASNVVSQFQAGHAAEARKTLEGVFAQHSRSVVESLDTLAHLSRPRRR